jgi:uncharacterized protein YyaL (SSP411 family)
MRTLKSTLTALLLSGLASAAVPARGAERLRGEPSAFLREFADSPVDWMPWGDAALARARAEGRPVFLFIGSFTSELAAAMRRQSFANARNADWLNKQFVCVIVDRDERPDVAELYQEYVNTMKQVSGWPLNVFLTPEFQPYEGATYLSPSEDWGAPGFLKLASQARAAWTSSPESCRRHAKDAVAQMAPSGPRPPAAPPAFTMERARSQMAASAAAWQAAFDATDCGFGDAPRSPEPELLRFMLTQSDANRESALKALRAMASSAVRDPLDGGFFRHAADSAWRIPYQQKVLADQARIALAYLDGARGGDAGSFISCAKGALGYAVGRLGRPDGTFADAEDATGDGFTGTYAWTAAEIDSVLGPDSPAFKSAHGVLPGGNVSPADDPSSLFAQKNLLLSEATPDPVDVARAARLLAVRDRRPAPLRDERASAGAHGLMVAALARAGAQLSEAKYFAEARRTVSAIRRDFLVSPDGTLRRFKDSALPAAAEDYAAVGLGLREFARAAKDRDSGALADRVLSQLDARFLEATAGSYYGAPDPPGAAFFMRPSESEDPPTASCLAVSAGVPGSGTVAAAILKSIQEANAQAPGDQLLALAIQASRPASP